MSANGALRLSEVRARAAAALAPSGPQDPEVLLDIVDALHPPALLLLWADPWLNPTTMGMGGGSGLWDAWLEVLCVAGRVEPGPGMTRLEELVGFALARFRGDTYTWPPETFYAPRRFDIGGITYLGARMVFRVPVVVDAPVAPPTPEPPLPTGKPWGFSTALSGAPAPGVTRLDDPADETPRRLYVSDLTAEDEDVRAQLLTVGSGDLIHVSNEAGDRLDFAVTRCTARSGFAEYEVDVAWTPPPAYVPTDGQPVWLSVTPA